MILKDKDLFKRWDSLKVQNLQIVYNEWSVLTKLGFIDSSAKDHNEIIKLIKRLRLPTFEML